MGILMKFTLKSIGEKKFRTFLILLSISLSVALSLSSFAMRDIVKNSIMANVMSFFGSADVMVVTGEKSIATPRLKNLESASKYFDYKAGQLSYNSEIIGLDDKEDKNVSLKAINLKDAKELGQIELKEDLGLNFEGKQVYISEFTADKYNYKLGQYIELNINNTKHKFKIAGIAYNKGAVSSKDDSTNMMMPAKTLSGILGYRGSYMMLLFRTAPGVDKNEAIEALQEIYPRDEVRETVPWSEIDNALNMIIVPFIFMLILVLATSVFIIYTAFKVITKEKLPVLGTFRSIGATKRSVDFILLLESVFYGFIGGLIGIAIGKLILFGIAYAMINNLGASGNVDNIAKIHFIYYIISISFGIVLSLVSSIVPIIAVSKLSVRDIVLGFNQQFKEVSKRKVVISLLILTLALIIPYIESINQNIAVNLISLVLLCVAVIMLVPFFVKILLEPCIFLAKILFGNLGSLAAKNLKENRAVLNNIALLTIGIASILLINTLSNMITEEVAKLYNKADFDIYISGQISKQRLSSIKRIPGIEESLPELWTNRIEVADSDVVITVLEGTDSRYFDFWHYNFKSSLPDFKERLNYGRGIILSNTLASKLDKQVGDKLVLKIEEKGKTGKKTKDRVYTVIATVDTVVANGMHAVVNLRTLQRDMGVDFIGDLSLKASNPEAVKKIIEEKYGEKEYLRVRTLKQMQAENEQQNAVIIAIFSSFSIIAMAIGSIGILNNFLVSLMARQKSIAVMKSVGMSRKQTFRMLSLEALISGTIGGITGIIGGILLTKQVSQFLSLVDFPFKVSLSMSILLSGLLLSIIISLLSTIFPARKVAKQNIVSAIKYE